MQKICYKCKETKNVSDFVKCSSNKSGYGSYCKLCNHNKVKEFYATNKNNYRINLQNWNKKNRQFYLLVVNKIKSKYGCQNCKESIASCLDFHHLDKNQKDIEISRLVNFKSKNKLIKEINKCVVLCSNCHRKLHAGDIVLQYLVPCNEKVEDYFSRGHTRTRTPIS